MKPQKETHIESLMRQGLIQKPSGCGQEIDSRRIVNVMPCMVEWAKRRGLNVSRYQYTAMLTLILT